MEAPQSIRVLLADDHAITREGLAALIRRHDDMLVVGQARTGSELIDLHSRARPDVTVVQLALSQVDALLAMRTIRESAPEARFIVISKRNGEEDVFRSVRAGARGYLLDSASHAELLTAIRAVHAGHNHLPPPAAEALARHVAGPTLTPREREVLEHMAMGLANREIGERLFIAPGSVKAHVHNILGKLHARDRTHAVTLAARRGLVRLDD